jgi:hypothetical protein
MIPNLRSVSDIASDYNEPTSTDIEHELKRDRAHIATVLIAGLEERKETIRVLYDTQMEERVHRLHEVDTAIALIKATLTDVTSEEK